MTEFLLERWDCHIQLIYFKELDLQTVSKDLSVVEIVLCVYLPFLLAYKRGTASFLLFNLIVIHLGSSNSFPFFQTIQFLKIFSLFILFLIIQSCLIKLVFAALFLFSFSLDEFQLSLIPFVLSFAGFL